MRVTVCAAKAVFSSSYTRQLGLGYGSRFPMTRNGVPALAIRQCHDDLQARGFDSQYRVGHSIFNNQFPFISLYTTDGGPRGHYIAKGIGCKKGMCNLQCCEEC